MINIHFMASYFQTPNCSKVVNFVHGSEICLTSPNLLKAIYKKLFRRKFLKILERSYFNIFISEFTLKVAAKQGLSLDYSRDLVIPNSIAMGGEESAEFKVKSILDDRLVLSCIARDVPHKNIDGAVRFAELLAAVSARKVELWLAPGTSRQSHLVEICYISGSDLERDELYKRAHLNLLLSLDHQKRGFFEGFGLVVLEAALYYTPSVGLNQAGLVESIHHDETGWLLGKIDESEVLELWQKMQTQYEIVAKNCYEHTRQSHGLEVYRKLLGSLL